VILSGTVEVVRGDAIVNRLGEGNVFGEAGALDAGPGYALARNATIRAAGELELGVLSEADFTRLFADSGEFRTAVHALLSARS
jgi:CRP-like cAMP-binding protein